MSDNLERLRARDEHLAQWAAGEIERLLEETLTMFNTVNEMHSALHKAKDEFAALKAQHGEPVYYEITTHDGIKWVGKHPSLLPNHTSTPLYFIDKTKKETA